MKAGDTLARIGRTYGVPAEQIRQDNRVRDPRWLRAGQELRVRRGGTVQGLRHRVRPGETVAALARRYNVTITEIAEVNGLREPDRIAAGQLLLIPGGDAAGAGDRGLASPAAALGLPLRGVRLRWPLEPPVRFTSPFGPRDGLMHNGIDLAAPRGTPVYAAADGEVTLCGTPQDAIGRSAGHYVVLRHAHGVKTLYFHNSRVTVRKNQRVRAGEVIAYTGNTGRSYGENGGYHLHFEVRDDLEPVDPLRHLPPLR